MVTLTAIAFGAAALAIGSYYVIKIRPGTSRGETSLRKIVPASSDFDLAFELPGRPHGAASNGREILIGNGSDPWGAIRIRRDENEYNVQLLPIVEPLYNRKTNLDTLTWNGSNYIGYTTASWFRSGATGNVFTIHDPASLRVIDTRDAPPLLGCLAWDGAHYWAATRKNTRAAAEEAFFYKLDRDFRVVSRSKPPAVGCQGLTWDGEDLWFADVFDDSIHVLDVNGAEPRIVHRQAIPFDYLSGVVEHEEAIWVLDYDKNRLQRLRPSVRVSWAGGSPAAIARASMVASAEQTTASQSEEGEAELRRQLRSDDRAKRMHAEMELGRRNASIDYAREENRFARRPAEGTEALDWVVELRDDGLWLVSSRVWFGPELFVPREQNSSVVTIPIFARYTFTVKEPGGLETEKELQAVAGENVLSNVRLTDGSASGPYRVSLFIHVQYLDAAGTGRILNNSAGSVELRK